MSDQRIKHRHSGWHEHTMADLGDATEPHTHALAAVPAHTPGALDVERLARAIDTALGGHILAPKPGKPYAREYAEAIARTYEAASPSEETR